MRGSRLVTGGSNWCRYNPVTRRLTVTLHVQPNARRSEIAGLHGDALKIRVAALAMDNKANAALIEFLSETLDVPKAAVTVRRGATGRRKVVEILCGPDAVTRLVNSE